MHAVTIHPRGVVDGADRDGAWATYLAAFEPLRSIALQRHLMTRAEFDEVCDDVRVVKYLAVQDGEGVVGMGTMTNRIEAMPLVEPAYFAHRWPEHWAAGRCYYIGFVASHPDRHGSALFTELVQVMSYMASLTGGVTVLDVCSHHVEQHALPQSIERITASVVTEVALEQVDAQTYWAYELPVPDVRPAAVIELRDGSVTLPDSAYASNGAGRP